MSSRIPTRPPKVVLCDIEGTTTSISFVKDVLFPFAKAHSKLYLTRNWETDQVKQIVKDLVALQQFQEFTSDDLPSEENSLISKISDFVDYLIDKDLKLAPLKTLQGLVWEEGYVDGTLKGHVYDDVPVAFEEWTSKGIHIWIYSSGSVAAQKLLFKNSDFGDLLSLISGHFDTAVGHKQEASSYENILKELALPAEEVVFLTDVAKEAEAAIKAGIDSIILDRPGNAPLSDDERNKFTVVKNLSKLFKE